MKRGGLKINSGGKINFFIAKMHIHQQAVDSVSMFLNAGYKVDVFLYQSSDFLCDFKSHRNLKIFNYTENDLLGILPSLPQSENLFKKEYLQLINKTGFKKIAGFGTGELAKKILEIIPIKIDFFVDNDSTKWNNRFLGAPILSPKELQKEKENTLVLITSSFYKDISIQLETIGFVNGVNFFNGVNLADQYYFNEIVIPNSESIINSEESKAFIGIEKFGMIWAGILSKKHNIPFLYHSLELYTSDHENWADKKYDRLRLVESFYHTKAVATIIQDTSRAQVLLNDNKVQNGKCLFVPVSISETKINNETKDILKSKHQISKDRKIILLMSAIMPNRFCEELVNYAQNIDDKYQFVIHGPYFSSIYLEKLKKLDEQNKIVFSTDLVSQEELQEIISSAYIGLAFYRKFPLNDQLTIFSSEKIARYLHNGIPVITFDYTYNKEFINEQECGECIRDINDLSNKIELIDHNYDKYSLNAKKTFSDFYDFEKKYFKVVEFVQRLEW